MTNSSELWDKKQKKKHLDVGSLCPELCLPGGTFLTVLPCENNALFLNFRSMSRTHLLLIVMERKNQTADLLEEARISIWQCQEAVLTQGFYSPHFTENNQ